MMFKKIGQPDPWGDTASRWLRSSEPTITCRTKSKPEDRRVTSVDRREHELFVGNVAMLST
jgi:hypothetical protein